MLECWLAWSGTGLVQAITVGEFRCCCPAVMIRRYCFVLVLPDLWLLQSFHLPLSQWSLSLWGREFTWCSICAKPSYCSLFSAAWLVVSFHISHCLLHKETSLMRSENKWKFLKRGNKTEWSWAQWELVFSAAHASVCIFYALSHVMRDKKTRWSFSSLGASATATSISISIISVAVNIYLCLCLSVYLFVCLCLCLSIFMSIYFHVYVCICLYLLLSMSISMFLSISVYICLSLCLSTHLCPSVSMSVSHLSLSISLFISVYGWIFSDPAIFLYTICSLHLGSTECHKIVSRIWRMGIYRLKNDLHEDIFIS